MSKKLKALTIKSLTIEDMKHIIGGDPLELPRFDNSCFRKNSDNGN